MELAILDRLPVVKPENGIVEFVEKLSMVFGLFDDNIQICLQSANLMTEMTISSNMGKKHFQCFICRPRLCCNFNLGVRVGRLHE